MLSTPVFYMERKGEIVKLIFPRAQQYAVNTYHKSPRCTYQVMEPVYTPTPTIQVSRDTAKALFHEAQAVDGVFDFQYSSNHDWWMAIRGIGVLGNGRC